MFHDVSRDQDLLNRKKWLGTSCTRPDTFPFYPTLDPSHGANHVTLDAGWMSLFETSMEHSSGRTT